MAERRAPKAAAKATVKPRLITQNVEHVVETSLDRRDGSGKLIRAIIDLGRGTVRIEQPTVPITFKGKTVSDDVQDVIDFYTGVKAYVDNAPAPVLVYDKDETEAAPATA